MLLLIFTSLLTLLSATQEIFSFNLLMAGVHIYWKCYKGLLSVYSYTSLSYRLYFKCTFNHQNKLDVSADRECYYTNRCSNEIYLQWWVKWSRWSCRRNGHPLHNTWFPPSPPEWSPIWGEIILKLTTLTHFVTGRSQQNIMRLQI